MDYSGRVFVAARRVGQKAGVLRPMVRAYRRLFNIDYEAAFDNGVKARIRPGDTVWDVGANIGHYSLIFAGLAGSDGRIIAIEPSPSSLPVLREAVAGLENVIVEPVALSTQNGEASFFLNDTGQSVVDGLSRVSAGAGGREIKVPVLRGDELAAKYPPNLIKIDVEGFETEVLEGLAETLKSPGLHTVAVEVHFLTMTNRGRADGPGEIRRMLEGAGFRIRWTDPSHLVARR